MIASFGDKQFEVSDNKILTPSNITFSESLNVEEQDRAGDKPAIYVKSLGSLSMSLDVKLDARWVDVQQEIVYWLVKMRAAAPEILTIGTRSWGAGKSLLKSVSVSDLVILGDGTYAAATLALEFVEYVADGVDDNGNTATIGPGIKAARIQLEQLTVNTPSDTNKKTLADVIQPAVGAVVAAVIGGVAT